MTVLIENLLVSRDPAVQAAAREAQQTLPAAVLAHSIRSFSLGEALTGPDKSIGERDRRLLLVAALLHDIGLYVGFRVDRFEIAGADVARALLADYLRTDELDELWWAIALHTERGFPERASTTALASPRGTACDLLGFGMDAIPATLRAAVIADPTRLTLADQFAQALVERTPEDRVVDASFSFTGCALAARRPMPEIPTWESITRASRAVRDEPAWLNSDSEKTENPR